MGKDIKEIKPTDYAQKGVKGFQKGNPGKPDGASHFYTGYKKALKKYAKENGLDYKDELEQLFLVAHEKAKKGDFSFWNEIITRIYGKPSTNVDVTSKGESIQGNEITFVNFSKDEPRDS